jgi:bud site selection protein 31
MKSESIIPVIQLSWQKSRYIYDLYYIFHRISRETYDYCINAKIVDAPLIAKWKKAGYESLCSTYVITTSNYKFGGTSICRVPRKERSADNREVVDSYSGCTGCASGSTRGGNIFGNKYGQRLAGVQVGRERREERKRKERAIAEESRKAAGGGDDETDSSDDEGPAPAPPQKEAAKKGADDDTDTDDSDDEGPKKPVANIWGNKDEVAEGDQIATEASEGGGDNSNKKARK